MGLISDAAEDRGDFARRLTETNRDVAAARTARRVASTSVGPGGVLRMGAGSELAVDEDGRITLAENGRLHTRYPSGRVAVVLGPVMTVSGALYGFGIHVNGDVEAGDILQAATIGTGERRVRIGEIDKPVDIYRVYASDWRSTIHGSAIFSVLGGGELSLWTEGWAQLLAQDFAGFGGVQGTYLYREDGGAVSANVHMTDDGQILRVGSTSKLKCNIQDLEVDPDAVLRMRPRSWAPAPAERRCPPWAHRRHTDESQCPAGDPVEPPEDAPRQVGFIAEELDALGLHEFVEYDQEGLPASIHYDRLTAAVIPLVQRQQAQIDALTARLDALESKET